MTTVSDHAVVRWLERVKGVDVEAIRKEIMRSVERCENAVNEAGLQAHYSVISGRITFVMKDRTVVTIKTRTMGPTAFVKED